MKKIVLITVCLVAFGLGSISHSQAQLSKAFKIIDYSYSLYEAGKGILEDLGWSWWDDDGFLSITTDRKDGVSVYINDEKLADVFPSKHANYKVEEGTYTMIVYDRKRKKKSWYKTFTITEDEITEITITKDGWNKRGKKLQR